MKTPQIVLTPIGTRYPAISIPGVGQVRGVLIDNPSGSWLLLRPTFDYIPPYTIGWARSFAGGVAAVDIAYEAPSGQVSTLQGDPAIVVLDTDPVPDSGGSANGAGFIDAFTPLLSSLGIGTFLVTRSAPIINGATVLTGVANKQLRLAQITLDYNDNSGGLAGYDPCISPVAVQLATINPSGTTVARLRLDSSKPNDRIVYNPQLPLPVGASLRIVLAQTSFADVNLNLHFLYYLT